MNCFNCQKLAWEIEMERRKKGVSWWKVIGGVVIGLITMLGSWYLIGYLITQRHQNIIQERKKYLQNNPQEIPKWEQLVRDRNIKLMEEILEKEKSIMTSEEYQKRKELVEKIKKNLLSDNDEK